MNHHERDRQAVPQQGPHMPSQVSTSWEQEQEYWGQSWDANPGPSRVGSLALPLHHCLPHLLVTVVWTSSSSELSLFWTQVHLFTTAQGPSDLAIIMLSYFHPMICEALHLEKMLSAVFMRKHSFYPGKGSGCHSHCHHHQNPPEVWVAVQGGSRPNILAYPWTKA